MGYTEKALGIAISSKTNMKGADRHPKHAKQPTKPKRLPDHTPKLTTWPDTTSCGNPNGEKESRKAIFTFTHQKSFEVGPPLLSNLCELLEVADSVCAVKALCPAGNRDSATAEAYRKLDQLILPHLSLAVFFSNFLEPRLVFAGLEKDEITFHCSQPDPRLLGAQLTYFGLFESDGLREWWRLEAVRAMLELAISVLR